MGFNLITRANNRPASYLGRGAESGSKKPPRLVLWFAVITAIGLALAAACILLFVRHSVTQQAERSATRQAQFVAEAVLRHQLEPKDFAAPVTGTRREQLDRLFRSQVLLDGTILVKLYGADSTITYSNEHSLIGSRSSNDARILEVAGGTIRTDVSSTGAEGLAGTDQKVLRTYVPIPFSDGKPGVVSLNQDYTPIAGAAKAAFFPIAGILEALLVLLFIGLVPLMARVTRRVRRQMEEIERQALHDDLTGLPNRKLFRDRVEQAVLSANRERDEVAVMLIDLDQFKEINDTLGHQSGDALLIELASRLRSVLRESETFARLGGDEFGVVLPKVSDEGVASVAERIQAALNEPLTVSGLSLVVEGSIGISVFPDHGSDVDALIRRADIAMYVAKDARVDYAIYSEEDDTHDASRLSLLGELRRAIEEEELVLHFQPKADLTTGQIRGGEALVRWQHPSRGLMAPGEFVPLAERTGLIKPLSRYVLETAIRQCGAWRRAGLDLHVAVNLTMHDLLDLELPDEVARLLAAADVEATGLALEITESTIMADPFRVKQVLDRLADMGVRLAIDDFGTGYSSLGYLKSLPVDEIKIDQSFVMNMTQDRSDATIVQSTIDLGHNLGLKVVAEGVEDEAVWCELQTFGCDVAQGYFISRPVVASEFDELVQRSQVPGSSEPDKSKAGVPDRFFVGDLGADETSPARQALVAPHRAKTGAQ